MFRAGKCQKRFDISQCKVLLGQQNGTEEIVSVRQLVTSATAPGAARGVVEADSKTVAIVLGT